MKLFELTAHEILDQLKAGKVTADAVVSAVLARAREVNPGTKALIRYHEKMPAGGAVPIPVAVKDNISVKGEMVTCASRILDGFRPPYDAAVIEKLKASGSVIVGTANMDEFAFGSSCETSCYGPTSNPWASDRVPGGSSGGSAAAVAAGQAVWALGSDTGGSIRQPAAF